METKSWTREVECWGCGNILVISKEDIMTRSCSGYDEPVPMPYFVTCNDCGRETDIKGLPDAVRGSAKVVQ